MLWCVATAERREKSIGILSSLAQGWPSGARLTEQYPPEDGNPFAVWGQIWIALNVIPKAIKANRPFWQIDNGYWRSRKVCEDCYYRLSYRSLLATFWPDAPRERGTPMRNALRPWRKNGKHIVIALPSLTFGQSMGIDTGPWIASISARVRAVTDRRIIIREKKESRPISDDLANAWALVTHSSNACVDAMLAGIPAFVEPTAPTAPLGNLDLAKIETPELADRDALVASMMSQSFLLSEMQSGLAHHYLSRIAEFVDRKVA